MVVTLPYPLLNFLAMRKKDIITLVLLISATLFTAALSVNSDDLKYLVFVILIASGIKFSLIAFQFMELKKAHTFWKTALICFLVIFFGVVSIIVFY